MPVEKQYKITDEQLVAMTQQYTVAHDAYKEINRQVAEGRQWSKCPNCGNVYPWDRPGSSASACSSACFIQYLAYLTEETRGWHGI